MKPEIEKIIRTNYARTSLGSSTWRAIRWKKEEEKHTLDKSQREPLHTCTTPWMVKYLDLNWFQTLCSSKTQKELLSEVADKAKKLAAEATDPRHECSKHRELTEKQAFGYAAKAIALYMRSVIENRMLLSEETAKKLRPWCPCAIDSFIFDHLKEKALCIPLDETNKVMDKIKDYNEDSWIELQINIADYCKRDYGTPVDFDYVVWTEATTRARL